VLRTCALLEVDVLLLMDWTLGLPDVLELHGSGLHSKSAG